MSLHFFVGCWVVGYFPRCPKRVTRAQSIIMSTEISLNVSSLRRAVICLTVDVIVEWTDVSQFPESRKMN